MHDQSPHPAPRLLFEGLVVIASILIAFAIDAWWDERVDRKSKLALLARLHADFEAMRPELLDVEREHRLRHEASLKLLDILAVGDTLPANPEVDAGVALVFIGSRTFQPGTGAVEAFVNSEGARLVDNSRLADLLLMWPGLVEELQEEEQRLLDVATVRWTPFLASRTNLAPYIAVFEEYDPVLGSIPVPHLSAAARVPVTIDQDFLNLVLERFTYQSLAMRDIAPLKTAVDEILALLSRELDLDAG